MTKRYHYLKKEEIYEALNRVRDSFLAAKDGEDVDKIINFILTDDERLRIGRRILIADLLESGFQFEGILRELKVGSATVSKVAKNKERNKEGYLLIKKRGEKVENEYQKRAYRKEGGSKLAFKKKKYTGFKRKDVGR